MTYYDPLLQLALSDRHSYGSSSSAVRNDKMKTTKLMSESDGTGSCARSDNYSSLPWVNDCCVVNTTMMNGLQHHTLRHIYVPEPHLQSQPQKLSPNRKLTPKNRLSGSLQTDGQESFNNTYGRPSADSISLKDACVVINDFVSSVKWARGSIVLIRNGTSSKTIKKNINMYLDGQGFRPYLPILVDDSLPLESMDWFSGTAALVRPYYENNFYHLFQSMVGLLAYSAVATSNNSSDGPSKWADRLRYILLPGIDLRSDNWAHGEWTKGVLSVLTEWIDAHRDSDSQYRKAPLSILFSQTLEKLAHRSSSDDQDPASTSALLCFEGILAVIVSKHKMFWFA